MSTEFEQPRTPSAPRRPLPPGACDCHAHVFGPGDALKRADDRRCAVSPENIAKRQARRQRVRIRLVVQHDQDAIGVREVALVLLHAGAGERPAELGRERSR